MRTREREATARHILQVLSWYMVRTDLKKYSAFVEVLFL